MQKKKSPASSSNSMQILNSSLILSFLKFNYQFYYDLGLPTIRNFTSIDLKSQLSVLTYNWPIKSRYSSWSRFSIWGVPMQNVLSPFLIKSSYTSVLIEKMTRNRLKPLFLVKTYYFPAEIMLKLLLFFSKRVISNRFFFPKRTISTFLQNVLFPVLNHRTYFSFFSKT